VFKTVLILLFLVSSALAARIERLIDTWRPEHYLVNITLNDQLSELSSASAVINILVLKQTSAIDLDFGDLTVDAVMLDSKPATFTHKDGKLLVNLTAPATPGTRLVVTINYHGKPKDGLILTNDKDGKPSAVGDNWPDRVHNWIPTLDHPSAKATVTFNITAPTRDEAVANGRLDHVETTANGQRTWTYTEGVPIPPYCMIIAVGQFAKFASPQQAVTPLSYYVSQSDSPFALKGFAPANPSLQFYTQTVAPYPYEKLALIVGATRFGGMENSSAIVFTSNLFTRGSSSVRLSKTYGIPMGNVGVVAHEIAHQWFGDDVTESTWSDLWLSEGFATYFAGLFMERYESEEAFRSYMKDAAASVFAFEKKSRTPIFDRETESLMGLLNANSYQKGAWVLHMLRSRLGDDAFFRGIRRYYESHKHATASTEDLRAALEKSSHRDLRAFFARWVYDSGHPQYELTWQWSGKSLRLELRQVQAGNAFLDALPISITSASGSREIVLKPGGKQLIETLRVNEKPTRIEIDPRNTLLDEAIVRGI
jgi:aminopeptidase N